MPDYASNLALYLLENTGTIFGTVCQRMTAQEQRSLFGRFLGKGLIIVNGQLETVTHRIKIAFGMDWEDNKYLRWKDL